MDIPVFVVEDSREMHAALLDLFDNLGGFQVAGWAATEGQAMEWLHQPGATWRLAVIDLLLQEGSGFNVLMRCASDAAGGKLVVLSDFATPGVKERCLALGAHAVFTKGEAGLFAAWLEDFRHQEQANTRRQRGSAAVR